jgi:hypothetical protein
VQGGGRDGARREIFMSWIPTWEKSKEPHLKVLINVY